MATAEDLHASAAKADDATLVRSIVAGERAAFERLMRRYNRRLFRIARAVLDDPAEAEDALQEAYLTVLKSLTQFRGDASLSTWLSRVVLSECLGRRRRSDRRQNIVPIIGSMSDDEVGDVTTGDSERPDRMLGRAQLRELLERKLDALPELFRIVFVLRSVEDMSVEETAQCLGVPEVTVRTRYFRAKRLLRESLAEEIDLAERDVFDFGGDHCDRVVAAVLRRLDEALPAPPLTP
jgi:RNA polymerase sigma-70 factor (ECF subfamily)